MSNFEHLKYQNEDWVNRCLPKLERDKSVYTMIGSWLGLIAGKIALGALYATGAVIALELMGYL